MYYVFQRFILLLHAVCIFAFIWFMLSYCTLFSHSLFHIVSFPDFHAIITIWVKNVSLFRVALPIRLHCQVFARYVLEHFRYRPELQEETQTSRLARRAETRPHKGNESVGLIRLDERWFAQNTICRGPCCASRSAHGDVAGRAVTSQSSLLSRHPAEIPVPLPPQRGGRGDRPNSFLFSVEKMCKK